jgi:hypothetical protein
MPAIRRALGCTFQVDSSGDDKGDRDADAKHKVFWITGCAPRPHRAVPVHDQVLTPSPAGAALLRSPLPGALLSGTSPVGKWAYAR